jgi:hypothetical protein
VRWVTRSAPHVDRMACAWLIRRGIDPDAQFCFVPTRLTCPPMQRRSTCAAPSCRTTARTARSSHAQALRPEGPVLHELALLVHEADLADDRFYAPAALGLDLVTRGISLVCDNDEALTVGMRIFDGLYKLTRQQLLRGSPAT